MKILITGSSGHLGEALVRTLRAGNHHVVGIDIIPSAFTNFVGSISDPDFVKKCMPGIEAVLHTATLHKPHVGTHSMRDFVDTNITGTLNLLEEAQKVGASKFIFTSTTSAFGDALNPSSLGMAAWITEDVVPIPKNIYGVTKTAAEDMCRLFHRNKKLPCVILRTSRFFPEEDDKKETRQAYTGENAKANELLYRRVDMEDVVTAHICAIEKAPEIGFGKYIISATSPFEKHDMLDLQKNAPEVLKSYYPEYEGLYTPINWKMFPKIDRVYVNEKARLDLGWKPKYDFEHVLDSLKNNREIGSPLSQIIGSKGYHPHVFDEGPYPVD